jgi:oligosaccharide repeat unit polymerase
VRILTHQSGWRAGARGQTAIEHAAIRRLESRRSCHPSAVLSSITPAVFTGIVFLVALRRLPVLHPVQVWSGSWAVSTLLYALRLLPYRSLSWLTAGLICGAVAVFTAAVPVGNRLAHRHKARAGAGNEGEAIALAALLSIAALTLTLAAFLAQIISRFGVGPVVRIAPEVKAYLASGAAPLSGTYVDLAIVATVLCALAGVFARTGALKRGWLVAAAGCAGTVYFSTSRGFIVVALIAGLTAIFATMPQVNGRRLVTTSLVAGLVILAMFIGLGSLLGKTYRGSTIGQFDNFFSRHPAVSSLALPYQDLTASIPALDLLVGVSPTWGSAHGCATAPIPCGVIRKLGVPAERVPVAGPFTKAPLPWNGYTFLDRFLIDGGTALTLVFVAATGMLAGYFWTRSRAGSVYAILIYAIGVPVMLAAYRQNLIELVFVASIFGTGMIGAARLLSRFGVELKRRSATFGV